MNVSEAYDEGYRDGESNVRSDFQTWACGHITHLIQGDWTECPWCGRPASDRVVSIPPRPDGVVGALLALGDLRVALSGIRQPHPAYAPGTEPTEADHCAQLLDMIDRALEHVAAILTP